VRGREHNSHDHPWLNITSQASRAILDVVILQFFLDVFLPIDSHYGDMKSFILWALSLSTIMLEEQQHTASISPSLYFRRGMCLVKELPIHW